MDDFNAANQRRLDLIKRKYGGGLTEAEAAELERLRADVFAHMEREFPRPAVNTDRLDRIEARLRAARGEGRG